MQFLLFYAIINYMSTELKQSEIEYLLTLEKNYVGSQKYKYPTFGGKLNIQLSSSDKNEEFILDVWRSHITLSKNTFQNRAKGSIILLRLDLDPAPHRNPDGEVITGSHLHIYKEGYGDKIAYSLPEFFDDCTNAKDFLEKFMDYCHIINKPIIEEDLFI